MRSKVARDVNTQDVQQLVTYSTHPAEDANFNSEMFFALISSKIG